MVESIDRYVGRVVYPDWYGKTCGVEQYQDRSGAGFVTLNRYQDRSGAGFVTLNRYQGPLQGLGTLQWQGQ